MSAVLRARSYLPPGHGKPIWDLAVLAHDERRVRRRAVPLVHGDEVLVDFPEPLTFAQGGALELEDGRCVEIIAAEEHLIEVRGRDTLHLMELCWHLGNRHLKVQIEHGQGDERALILRDHVIRDMLIGLGATVLDVSEPFAPLEGAYHHSHAGENHALLYRK